MADVTITITIPGAIYQALDTARKNDTLPNGTPRYSSIEAEIQDEFQRRFAPYAAELAKADPAVTALETQIAGLRAQLLQKTTPPVAVTKQSKP